MAYLDDEDEEELERLAGDRDEAGTIGEAMARSRAREELSERDRMDAPSTPEPEEPAPAPYTPPEPPDVSDEMEGLDLSALDSLEENARGAATNTTPEAPPPDDPEAAAAFDAWNEAEMEGHAEPDADEAGGAPDADADDLGTLGTAMDYNPAEAGRMTDADLLARADEADASLARRNEENAGRWTPTAGRGVDELMPEEVAFAGPPPSRDDETWGMATDADPTLPAAGPPPIEQPFDRGAGSDDMDMGEWSRTPGDPEPATAMSLGDFPDAGTPDTAPAMSMGDFPDDLLDTAESDVEERSAELPASSSKSTPYDRPMPVDDFTGADWSDAIRRPLHAIGAGLLAGSGRGSASPFRSERDALQARIDARNAAKGTATRAFEDREARSADREADRASREGIATMREERMATSDAARAEREAERLRLLERGATTRELEAESRIADRSSRIADREEGSDPRSDVSTRARSRLPAMVAGLPPELAETIRPELESMGEDLSADDVAALERMPATAWRAWLTRRRGLSGGAPGAGGGASGGTTGTLAEALRARGDNITDEEAVALGTTGLRRRLTNVLAVTGEGEIIDGVYGDRELIGAPGSVERRELRATVIRARRASEALADLAAVREEWGAAGVLPETAEADAAASIRTLMAYSTALGETGIISPGEVESIRRELPNPATLRGMAPGAFARRLESWRQSVVGSVEDDLEARGVSADSMDRALGWISSGSFDGGGGGERGAAETTGGGGTVALRDPETGAIYDIPEAEVAEYEGMGLERLR